MSRPSGNRRIAPSAEAFFGGAFQPNMKFMPLTRCTSKSPAKPVPYSLQQRHRAKYFGDMSGSQGLCGVSPCQVSQSRFDGDSPGGGGYSHAPVGSLRPSEPSTIVSVPIVPLAINSFAFAQITELTRCEPICTIRPVFCAAATIASPSAAECDIGFSQ